MLYWILCLLLLPFSVESDELKQKSAVQSDDFSNSPHSDLIDNLESEPSSFVGQVNVINGAYQEFAQDLVIPGPEPLIIQRICSVTTDIDEESYSVWNRNHSGFLFLQNGKSLEATVHGAFGSCRCFIEDKTSKEGLVWFNLDTKKMRPSLSNTASGTISGKTNMKNQSLVTNVNVDRGILTTGSGSTVIYEKLAKGLAPIRSETKANGNKILYSYDQDYCLKTITTTNSANQHFAHVVFTHYSNDTGNYSGYSLQSSDGRKVHYHIKNSLLRKVERSDGPTEKYEYDPVDKNLRLLSKKILPDGRYLATCYHPHSPTGKTKVFCQKAPLGYDQTPIVQYSFLYSTKNKKKNTENYTEVKDALNHKTRYYFSDDTWLTSIVPYGKENKPYRKEQFNWGRIGSSAEGNLISRTIARPDGIPLGGKAYQYDKRGNVLKETLFGNLTGNNPVDPVLNAEGYPLNNGCHHYSISYRYSQDGKNLVLEESYPNGKRVLYVYYPHTDLIQCRLTYDGERLALREFFTYDANAVLIQSVRDDGHNPDPQNLAGVTERLITRTRPKATMPCVGLPEEVIESCLDATSGKEILIKRIANEYDNLGHLLKQHHYDSNDVFAYTLMWDYDGKGRLCWEMNAVGEISYRHFDDNGNKTLEQGPDPRFHTEYQYDFMNRLIREEIVHRDGTRFGVSHRYDYLGNKIATVDGRGNETLYTYDFLSRLIEEKKPPVITSEGTIEYPTTQYTYDLLGYCTSITDPLGLKTEKICNLRGNPLLVHYPDGSAEYFSYTLEGHVENTIEKSKNQSTHSYDFLGRLIKKRVSTSASQPLCMTTAKYNTFHLMSEVDAAGVETRYTYDPAGRMASKHCGNTRTTYHYDSLGRVAETRDWLDEDHYQAKIQLYDFLNRVIEERVEDDQGNSYHRIQFSYDYNGKQSVVKEENQAGLALTRTDYDLYGRPTVVTDAEGNKTVTVYEDFHRNELGQNVLQTKQTDPLGNQTITTYDALNRVRSIVCQNSFGQKTRDQQVYYDLGNNKTRHIETVIASGKSERQVISLCEYDKGNRLIHFVEGSGSPEEKHTRWSYDKSGRKEKLIKADGTNIWQKYDALGFLKEYGSSDGSFHYLYQYNARGLPVEIEDAINKTKTLRTYDENGRLLQEVLGNGIAIEYTYDALGRPSSIALPDESGIRYVYEGPYLHTVERLSTKKDRQYIHTYAERDLSGNVIKEELGNGVILEHKCDLLGRSLENRTAHWQETDIQYDPSGNLLKRQMTDSLGTTPYSYAYDDLYQLSSEAGMSDHNYLYDSVYNRIKKDENTSEINSLNQVTSDAIREYRYDRNGNLATIGTKGTIETSFTYDALDRLVKVEKDEFTITYIYDAFNRRLTKTNGDIKTCYLYLGQNEIGAQVDETITELRILGTGKGAEIGAAVAIEIGSSVFVPVHDHNGNVAALLNEDGKIVESYRYTGFGEDTCFDSAGNVLNKAQSPWRFSSKRHDPETGLINFGRRSYDPGMGRWITPDPIGPESGPNSYAYVFNNPLTHFDQYGLFSLGGFFGSIFKCLGWVVGTVAYEGIPCVILKDAFIAVGHFLSGNGVDSFVPSYREQHSKIGSEGFYDETSKPINMGLNGIETSLQDVVDRARNMSNSLGGQKVYYVYNASHGFTSDILEWLGQRLGIPTNSAKKLASCIREELQTNPGRQIRLWLHSQGGEIGACLKNMLTSEELSHIEVNTFGSANLFDKGHFAKVTHYVSNRDWVPLLGNPLQYLKAALGGRSDIVYLKSINSHFFDHSYDGNTYQNQVKNLFNNS